MGCDVGKAMEGLENEQLQPFRHFTYITTHSPTLPLLYLHHSSFSNTSIASPTSQFILQPFFRFSYITSYSLNTPAEPRRPWFFHAPSNQCNLIGTPPMRSQSYCPISGSGQPYLVNVKVVLV